MVTVNYSEKNLLESTERNEERTLVFDTRESRIYIGDPVEKESGERWNWQLE